MINNWKKSKIINITLWIIQGILSLTFIWGGFMKIFHPGELPFPWISENSSLVLITGVVDLLIGFGILFPALFNAQAKFTIYVASGIIILMALAIGFHVSRGEANDIGINIFITLLAVFIIWSKQNRGL